MNSAAVQSIELANSFIPWHLWVAHPRTAHLARIPIDPIGNGTPENLSNRHIRQNQHKFRHGYHTCGASLASQERPRPDLWPVTIRLFHSTFQAVSVEVRERLPSRHFFAW
jgi:hypothetical protein